MPTVSASSAILAVPDLLGHTSILRSALVGMAILWACLFAALLLRRRARVRQRYISALEQLNGAALAIASSPGDMRPVLDRLASTARKLLELPVSRIYVLRPDSQELERVHSAGVLVDPSSNAHPIDSIFGARVCLQTRQPIVVGNALRQPLPDGCDRSLLDSGVKSMLVLPLIAYGRSNGLRSIGLMTLAGPRPRRFTDAQLRLADVLSSHAAVGIANARMYQQMEDALATMRRLQTQRDLLHTMTTAVQHASTLDEALRRIAEVAPMALEIDVCIVCLADAACPATAAQRKPTDADLLRVAAVTQLPYPFPIRVGMTDRFPNFRRVLGGVGKPLALENIEGQGPFKFGPFAPESGFGSVLYVPMTGRDTSNAIGVLVLLRRGKGKFPQEMIPLAEMFSCRAATAIENAHLHQQTSRDADTKATLLHELNHRVKNNLTGLMGLLAMGAPPMTPEVQRWLDRVTERIGALARAHELFSTRREARLSETIEATLDSLAAIKPDEVRVSVDVGDNDIVLPADRAVKLAMIIYELAYNAAVHGVGDAGRLWVSVRKPDAGHLAIDVIDDGGEASVGTGDLPSSAVGAGAAAVAAGTRRAPRLHRSGGVGLELVRGLVSRELRGTFEIGPNDRGGTTATVVFPLFPRNLRHELSDPS